MRNKGQRQAFYVAGFSYTVERLDDGRWLGSWTATSADANGENGESKPASAKSGVVIGGEEGAPVGQPTSCVLLLHGVNELDSEDPAGSAGALGMKQVVAHFSADGSLLSAQMENGKRRMSTYVSSPCGVNHIVTDDGRLLKSLTVVGKYVFVTTRASGFYQNGAGNVDIEVAAHPVDKMGNILDGKEIETFQVSLNFTSSGRTLIGNGTGSSPKDPAGTFAVQGRRSTSVPEA